MTRIRVTYTQEYDLPIGSEVINWKSGDLVKIGNEYFSPTLELWIAKTPLGDHMTFAAPDESQSDELYASLSSETYSIKTLKQ